MILWTSPSKVCEKDDLMVIKVCEKDDFMVIPAGCRVAARGEPAGFIFTIDCTLRASARHPTSPVLCRRISPSPGAHLWPSFFPSPLNSPSTPPPHPLSPILYAPSPIRAPPSHPCPLLGDPSSTRTHLRPPGPFRGGDQALLDRGIHQRHLIP